MTKRRSDLRTAVADESVVDAHCVRLMLESGAAVFVDSTLTRILDRPQRSRRDTTLILRDIALVLCRRRYAWLAAGVVSRNGIHPLGAHEQVEAWLDSAAVRDVSYEGAVLVTVVITTAAGALAPWHASSCEDVRAILEALPDLRARDLIAVSAAVQAALPDDQSTGSRPHEPDLVGDRVIVEIDLQANVEPQTPGAAEDPQGGHYPA
jgi:hypothetical protein